MELETDNAALAADLVSAGAVSKVPNPTLDLAFVAATVEQTVDHLETGNTLTVAIQDLGKNRQEDTGKCRKCVVKEGGC